eukprot:1161042-Pelagomonas_calceolata.AAC.8
MKYVVIYGWLKGKQQRRGSSIQEINESGLLLEDMKCIVITALWFLFWVAVAGGRSKGACSPNKLQQRRGSTTQKWTHHDGVVKT